MADFNFTDAIQARIQKVRDAFDGKKTINAIQKASADVESKVPPQDYSKDDFKFIPDQNRPYVYQNVNQRLKITGEDPTLANTISDIVKREANSLPQADLNDIGTKLKAANLKTIDDRINFLRDQVIVKRYNALPESTKNQIKDFVTTNKLRPDQAKELYAQAALLPEGSIDRVLTFAGQSGKELKDQSFGDFKKIFVDSAEVGKVNPNLVDSVTKIQNNIKALKENRVLRNFYDNNTDVQSLLNIDPESVKSITSGYQGAVPLIFSLASRPGRISTAGIVAMRSYLASDDPQTSQAYTYLSKQIFDDAMSGSWYVPPKSSLDTFKLYDWVLGRENVANTAGADVVFNSGVKDVFTGHIAKGMIKTIGGIEQNIALHQQFMKDNKINVLEYAGRQIKNLGITTAGLIATVVTDPWTYVGNVFKIGSNNPAILKLAEESLPVLGANKKSIIDASRNLETHIVTEVNKMTPYIDLKNMGQVERFLASDAPKTLKPSGIDMKTQIENIIKFRDMSTKLNQINDVRDTMFQLDMQLKRPGLLRNDATAVAHQLAEQGKIFNALAKDVTENGFSAIQPTEIKVLVKDGTQRLSKQGLKLMSQYRKATPIYNDLQAYQDEIKVATEALQNPKLIDGGVKLFGMEIPKTRYGLTKIEDAMSKVPFVNRFAGVNKQATGIMLKYLREAEGRTQMASEYIGSLTKNLTSEQGVRIRFAIENNKITQLDNAVKINEHGTLQDIANVVKRKYDDVAVEAMQENKRLFDSLKKRGLSDDAIVKVMKEEGGDLLGQYLENYQPLIYKNRKAVEALKDVRAYIDGGKSTRSFVKGIDLNAFDKFSLSRSFDNTADAYKAFIKDPVEKLGVDKAINDIILGVNAKENIAKLVEIGKKGLDPEIGLGESMYARLTASNRAVLKRRMNLDLAADLGIPNSISGYFKESAVLIDGNAVEFKGLQIPNDVKEALKELDAPALKSRLRMEVESGRPFNTEFNRLSTTSQLTSIQQGMKRSGLALLDAYDGVNNWFKKSVTSVFPKFHLRNALSSQLMNYADVGIDAFNPDQFRKISYLIGNKATKGVGRDMIFKNKFGQIVTGEEMLQAAKESGVFTQLQKVAGISPEDSYVTKFFKNPISQAMVHTGQGIEDTQRMMNFVSNWKNGASFAESAGRSQKMMIDYSNMSVYEREVANRIVPFYSFFKNNFRNTLETVIRNPERIFLPPKVITQAIGANIQAPPEGTENARFTSTPVFYPPQIDPVTGKKYVRQVTSESLPFEDVDRFFTVINEAFKGLRYLAIGDEAQAADSFANAGKAAVNNLMPSIQLPIAVVDQLLGGNIFPKKKLSPVLGKYFLSTSPAIRKMVGFEIRENKKTGELTAEYSPVANIIFTMMGGGRFLSQTNALTSEQADAIDKMNAVISPLSTKRIDIDQAKQIKQQISASQIKKTGSFFKKALENSFKQKALEQKYLEQNQ